MTRLISIIIFVASFVYAQTPYTYAIDSLHRKDGKVVYNVYGSPVNYKNKGKFDRIQTELTFDSVLKCWGQNKAPYISEFPEYSDDWFSFISVYEDANLILKSRPSAYRVKGVLRDDLRSVLYKDAFGQDIDLIVTAGHLGMTKEIRINSLPKGSGDMKFQFTMDFPTAQIISSKGSVDLLDFDFTGEFIEIGSKDNAIRFSPAFVWDSSDKPKMAPVKIRLFRYGNDVVLEKTIPRSFFNSAKFPVYTDHPTDYSSAGNGDGYVYARAQASYSIVRGYTTGYQAVGTGATGYFVESYVDADVSPSEVTILRGFVAFDCSALSGTVESASVFIRGYAKGTGENNSYSVVHCVQGTQASVSGLSVSDYDDALSTSFCSIAISSLTTSGWNEFALNSSGITHVQNYVGDNIKFGFRVGNDYSNSASANYYNPNFRIYFTEDASYKPYLSVTVAATTKGQVIVVSE